MKYKVDYYYLASGMEGRADKWTEVVDADTGDEARQKVATDRSDNEYSYLWLMGCLVATPLN
jgi:hypothetical protein